MGKVLRDVLGRFHAMQHAVEDRELAARRTDIDVVRLDLHPVRRLHHRQIRILGQQFRQQAGVARMLMRDDHKGHARIGRQMVKQLLNGLQATGRCPNPYDGETCVSMERIR